MAGWSLFPAVPALLKSGCSGLRAEPMFIAFLRASNNRCWSRELWKIFWATSSVIIIIHRDVGMKVRRDKQPKINHILVGGRNWNPFSVKLITTWLPVSGSLVFLDDMGGLYLPVISGPLVRPLFPSRSEDLQFALYQVSWMLPSKLNWGCELEVTNVPPTPDPAHPAYPLRLLPVYALLLSSRHHIKTQTAQVQWVMYKWWYYGLGQKYSHYFQTTYCVPGALSTWKELLFYL